LEPDFVFEPAFVVETIVLVGVVEAPGIFVVGVFGGHLQRCNSPFASKLFRTEIRNKHV